MATHNRDAMTDATTAARRDASASGLRYVSPDDPGIERRRAGRGFTYVGPRGHRIRSERELARIRAIAIPPAWTEVWVCPLPNGHIQATGRDARGRLQYRYHRGFRARRDKGKFERLVRFGSLLPRIRRRARRDLARRGLDREKVLAAVITLLDATSLRVGSEAYARVNRSFGLTTLRNRHATVSGATLRFQFRGKGGRTEERDLVDRRLAAVVRRCQELPGQSLFQYVDDDGEARTVSSDDVNGYLRDAAGTEDVSAKDFRTWTATVIAYRALRNSTVASGGTSTASDPPQSRTAAGRYRRNLIADALRATAAEIGDTVAITRSAYVHPGLLEAAAEEHTTGPVNPSPSRRRAVDRRPDRKDELEVLALLKMARRAPRRAPGSGRCVAPRLQDRRKSAARA